MVVVVVVGGGGGGGVCVCACGHEDRLWMNIRLLWRWVSIAI